MVSKNQPKFLVYAPSDVGGLAEHINYQVLELCRRGIKVEVLATRQFLSHKQIDYPIRRSLIGLVHFKNRWMKSAFNALGRIFNFHILAVFILIKRPSVVFIDSYVEYFSPFWVWPHLFFSKLAGFIYVTNLHDPVRDHWVGPQWFHDLSNKLAMSIYSVLLIHEKLPAECDIPDRIRILEVPVGVYEKVDSSDSIETFENPIPVPAGGELFLSYGFLRDNKNLDLFIESMVPHEEVYLLVAGRNQSNKDKKVADYQALAQKLNVANRICFDEGFISDPKTEYYFNLCDYVVLTYDKHFRSQSGVLNIAANYKKPVIASSGASPLQKCVEDYSLGVFCEPDSPSALVDGLKKLLANERTPPDWEAYKNYASWKTNIEILLIELKI